MRGVREPICSWWEAFVNRFVRDERRSWTDLFVMRGVREPMFHCIFFLYYSDLFYLLIVGVDGYCCTPTLGLRICYGVPFLLSHYPTAAHVTQSSTIMLALTLRVAVLSQWLRALRRRFAATRLLGMRTRIPPGAWMALNFECCVLLGKVILIGLITCPEYYYRL
jgi:hypothetical protein